MALAFLSPYTEAVLEWILLLSLVLAGLSALAFVTVMIVGRWRLAARLHARRGRHTP